MTVGVATIAGGNAGVFTAQAAGLFESRHLDVELVQFAGASFCLAAITSGTLSICVGVSGVPLIYAGLAGVDVVGVAALVATMPYSLMVSSGIQAPSDLEGKRIGISRFRTATDFATSFALARLGLTRDDVVIVPIGNQLARVAALDTGAIDATLVSPPGTALARRQGFHSLLDLAGTGAADLHNTIVTSRAFIREHADTVHRFLEAVAEGNARFKANRDEGLHTLEQYLRVDDPEALSEAHTFFSRVITDTPVIRPDLIGTLLLKVGDTHPSAATAKAEDFLDARFARPPARSHALY